MTGPPEFSPHPDPPHDDGHVDVAGLVDQPVTGHHPSAFVGASPEDWEQVRRSIAMLRPGAWAMKREQALVALDFLVRALRWRQEQPDQ